MTDKKYRIRDIMLLDCEPLPRKEFDRALQYVLDNVEPCAGEITDIVLDEYRWGKYKFSSLNGGQERKGYWVFYKYTDREGREINNIRCKGLVRFSQRKNFQIGQKLLVFHKDYIRFLIKPRGDGRETLK